MHFIKRTVLLATLGLATFGVSSCEKFTEDRDVNPNVPQDAPAAQQLRAAEIAEGYVFSGNLARVAGMWSGYFTGVDRQYASLNQYITAAGDYDNEWALAFEATANQARIVTNKALAVNNFQLAGIAQVVEANIIGTCTALWGDIPYSENFRVQTVSDNRSPKFDTQREVYTQVDALLATAITNLGKTGLSPEGRDIFYNGDTDKWIAAAHSLRARYLLQALGKSNDGTKLRDIIAEANAGISSSTNDLLMPYPGGAPGGDLNPYYDFIDYSRSGYMTADEAFAVGLLDSTGIAAGTPVGTRYNAKTDEQGRFGFFYTFGGDYGAPDPNYVDGAFAPDASQPLMTAVETKLILAECQARLNNSADALASLNEVRAMNATRFGSRYDAYETSDFGAGGIVNPSLSADAALLKEILTEKYLSLVGQIETFNDLRRTDNLVGVPKKSSTAPSIPQRFLIAQSEVNTNVNTPKPIPSLYVKTAVNN